MGRILYVDDEPAAREALARQFRGGPHMLVTAAEGRQALALARRMPFDAAILDLAMPGMSGLELLLAFRWMDLRFPVLILTGLALREDLAPPFARLGCVYLEKPCDPEVLERRLAALLAGGEGRSEPKARTESTESGSEGGKETTG